MKKPYLYLLLFIALFSCKKYEDGPWVSLRTKNARITGRWHFEYFGVDGMDSTSHLINAYSSSPSYTISPKDKMGVPRADGFNRWGIWRFNEHHKYIYILLDYSLPSSYSVGPYNTTEVKWEILRLTNKELWLKTNYNQKEYIAHLTKTTEL